MKKALSIIASVFLVVALATTGVFADSLSSYFGSPSNCTVSFTDDGFTLSFSTSNNGTINLDGTTSLHGVVEFTRTGSYQYESQLFTMTSGGVPTYELSNLSSGLRQSGSSVFISASTMSGSFEFDTTTGGQTGTAAHAYFKTAANGASYAQNASITYTFTELYVDGVPVVSSTVGEVIPFTLTPGYALVINGPCEVSDRTYSISGSWNFDKLATSRINGSFERLVQTNNLIDGFSPDRYLTIEQLLPWWADNSNVVGVASNYSYHNTDVITLSDGGVNYVLGYPLYYQGSGDYSVSHENAVSLTGSIYIQYSGTRPTISKIALESIADIVEGHYHYYNVFRPDVYDETGEVVSDGSGGTVVEFPDAPVGGGNSGQPPVNEETNLFGVLSKFVNDIKNLISQGSHAISELVNYGSSFMHSIAQMYDWLPATLTTLIVTAFSIVIVIGVIKLLWK